MKISKQKLKHLIKESLRNLILETSEDLEETFEEETKESPPETSLGSEVLYVFDFDDCLIDTASRRGLAPAYNTGKKYKTGSRAGQDKFKQSKVERDGKKVTFYYEWMRSRDYDEFKRNNNGQRPQAVKSPDDKFRYVSDQIDYVLCNMQGDIIVPKTTIYSKPIQGTVTAYKNAIANDSKVIILTSRIKFKNPSTMEKYLSKIGISNIEPYFATDTTTTKGQRLQKILNSPGFENIKSVVIYEDNIDKLKNMKDAAVVEGKSAEAILVVGNEDISSRSHPAIADGNVTYTYQRI